MFLLERHQRVCELLARLGEGHLPARKFERFTALVEKLRVSNHETLALLRVLFGAMALHSDRFPDQTEALCFVSGLLVPGSITCLGAAVGEKTLIVELPSDRVQLEQAFYRRAQSKFDLPALALRWHDSNAQVRPKPKQPWHFAVWQGATLTESNREALEYTVKHLDYFGSLLAVSTPADDVELSRSITGLGLIRLSRHVVGGCSFMYCTKNPALRGDTLRCAEIIDVR